MRDRQGRLCICDSQVFAREIKMLWVLRLTKHGPSILKLLPKNTKMPNDVSLAGWKKSMPSFNIDQNKPTSSSKRFFSKNVKEPRI